MPSIQQSGSRHKYPVFEDLTGHIEEAPEKYLARPIEDLDTALARIQGIDRLTVLMAWIEVEKRLRLGPDGGPRSGVMERLEERREFLVENGCRPENLLEANFRKLPPRFQPVDRSVPEKEYTWNGEPEEERSRGASAKLSEIRSGGDA